MMEGGDGMIEQEILERTYKDKADVYRTTSSKDPVTKQTQQSWQKVFANVKCALSQKTSGSHVVSDGVGTTSSGYILFCSPDAGILSGDRVAIITPAGYQMEMMAGQPFYYLSHLEIPLQLEGRVNAQP